jgi:hypothetical protein
LSSTSFGRDSPFLRDAVRRRESQRELERDRQAREPQRSPVQRIRPDIEMER